MTAYTAYFRSDADYAMRTFEADTPEQALKKARRFHRTHPDQLCFDHYDDCGPVNEIAIWDDEGDDLAVWRDNDLLLSLAACDLLAAAELVVARWERGDLAEAVRQLDTAIATAKGGAQ